MRKLIFLFCLFPLLIFPQTKESLYSPDQSCVFRETFNSEYDCRRNGGTPIDVTFSDGIGSFNGTSSKVNYALGLNGTYSVRVKCNCTNFVNIRTLFNCKGTNNDGAGFVVVAVNTGDIVVSNGTIYINGIMGTIINSKVNVEIIITGISLITGTGVNKTLIGSRHNNDYEFLGTIDLVEIYNRTLTAEEVYNLYHNLTFKVPVFDNTLIDFDALQGVCRDSHNDLTLTDVEVKRVGKWNNAYFNGTSSFVDYGYDPIGITDISFCEWVYVYNLDEGGQGRHIFCNTKANLRVLTNGNVELMRSNLSNCYSGVGAVKINEWVFISGTSTDAGISNLYIGYIDQAPILMGGADQNAGVPNAATSSLVLGTDRFMPHHIGQVQKHG